MYGKYHRAYLLLLILVSSLLSVTTAEKNPDFVDNEFAEFEDDEIILPPAAPVDEIKSSSESQTTKENVRMPAAPNDEDDYGVVDDEEKEPPLPEKVVADVSSLKFPDLPFYFHSKWASFQVEGVILCFILIYIINYFAGKSTNQNLAYDWFVAHKDVLEEQFALVGDDGISKEITEGTLNKLTDSLFIIWCSGRVGVSSLKIRIETTNRQDLLHRFMNLFTPDTDKIHFEFEYDPNELDPWVLAVGSKKHVSKRYKALADLSTYAAEKKSSAVPGIPNSWQLYSELSEAAIGFLDPGVLNLFRKYEDKIFSIHVSDRYAGAKLKENEAYGRIPDYKKIAQFTFALSSSKGTDLEDDDEMLQLIFYMIDKARRIRLSREAKSKAEKHRQTVDDSYLKTAHLQRQEAAQARREERTRERKQRILEEDDPEKSRRLEKLEAKHERKSKAPKMKQVKVR